MRDDKRLLILCLCGLIPWTLPPASRADPPAFASQLKTANEAMRSEPAKSYYEGPFNKAFYGGFSNWLNLCTQQTGQTLSDLDLLITLDPAGKVATLQIEPHSGLAECFAAQVRKEQFPPPPSSSLVVPASVRITKP